MDEGADIAFEGPTPDLIKMHQTYVDMLTTVISRATPDPRGTTAHEWMDLMDEQMRVTRTWQELFADFDVVLAPTLGVTAFPLTDEPDWNPLFRWAKMKTVCQLVFRSWGRHSAIGSRWDLLSSWLRLG
jgi:Asp-tRNA(Asn)/Glu-tRNA(Gln) amidotransferase A subunit family amidase